MKKESQASSTATYYVDETGKKFTITDIARGFRPKGKYKVQSMKELVKNI